MQAKLKEKKAAGAEKIMLPQLKELEATAKKLFKEKNEAAQREWKVKEEARQSKAAAEQQKKRKEAEGVTKKFLGRHFSGKPSASSLCLVVKTDTYVNITNLASAMGLAVGKFAKFGGTPYTVVAHKKNTIDMKIKELQIEFAAEERKEKQAADEGLKRLRLRELQYYKDQENARVEAEKQKQLNLEKVVRASTEKEGNWDVTGHYEV